VETSFSSVSLAGAGAGISALDSRILDAGLQAAVLRQNSASGAASALSSAHASLSVLFGTPTSPDGPAPALRSLADAFQTASGKPTDAGAAAAASGSLAEAAAAFRSFSSQTSSLASDSSRAISGLVSRANSDLSAVAALNIQIQQGSAARADVNSLLDQRDAAVSDLSSVLPVRTFSDGNGALSVRSADGTLLASGSGSASVLSWSPGAGTSSGNAGISGGVGSLSVLQPGGPASRLVLGAGDGNLGASLDALSSVFGSASAQADATAAGLRDAVNAAANRSVPWPSGRSSNVSARTFMEPGNTTASSPSVGIVPAALRPSPQRISLAAGDTQLIVLGPDGTSAASTSLSALAADPNIPDASGANTSLDLSKGVSLTDLAAKIQNWLRGRAVGGTPLSSATASLAGGKVSISTGNASASIALQDTASPDPASAPQDATVGFDPNGDGTIDSTSKGFSAFFGFGDLLGTQGAAPGNTMASQPLPAGWRAPGNGALVLSDGSGPIGPSISISVGDTLASVAAKINAAATKETAPAATQTLAFAPGAAVVLSAGGGVPMSVALPAGASSLSDVAAAIDSSNSGVSAKVVQDASGKYRLSAWSAAGGAFSLSFSGSLAGGASLSSALSLSEPVRAAASVSSCAGEDVLSISGADGGTLYASWPPASGGGAPAVASALDLGPSSSGAAATLAPTAAGLGLPPNAVPTYDSASGTWRVAAGDGSGSAAVAASLSAPVRFPQAGLLGAGIRSVLAQAQDSTAMEAQAASSSHADSTRQDAASAALSLQWSSTSGVNLDEETAKMAALQQSYAAAAKVISVIESMTATLMSIVGNTP